LMTEAQDLPPPPGRGRAEEAHEHAQDSPDPGSALESRGIPERFLAFGMVAATVRPYAAD
jgi:hypothetical protein